jgi:hypothetical protein
MSNEQQGREDDEVGVVDGRGQDLVSVTINGLNIQIHRGRRSVAEIKQAGGVPEVDVLAQQVDGKLRELPDDGHVVIKGGEQFVSYPRACASS